MTPIKPLDVDGQDFRFDEGWQAIKYDDDPFRKKRLSNDPAVDIVALSPRRQLYLFEVKDFRGPERSQQNRARVRSGQLFAEIGQKVRFSVAGLVGGGVRWHDSYPHLRPFAEALFEPGLEIFVVAWIEHDYVEHGDPARVRLVTDTDLLDRQVRWLRARALVINSQGPQPIAGLSVSDQRFKPVTTAPFIKARSRFRARRN